MNTAHAILAVADLAAISLLTFGVYYPRHRRRDLSVAFFGVNAGVFAVAAVLSDTAISAGLGFGLFGVLSIIRLRSTTISQREVAYYFSALALGLIGGLPSSDPSFQLALMGVIIGIMWIVDHPRILPEAQRQTVRVGWVVVEGERLREEMSRLLQVEVVTARVKQVDAVNGSSTVEVRFRPRSGAGTGATGTRSQTDAVAADYTSTTPTPVLTPVAPSESHTQTLTPTH